MVFPASCAGFGACGSGLPRSGGVGSEVFGAGFEHIVADLAGQNRSMPHLAADYRPGDSFGERPTDMEPVRHVVAVTEVPTVP